MAKKVKRRSEEYWAIIAMADTKARAKATQAKLLAIGVSAIISRVTAEISEPRRPKR